MWQACKVYLKRVGLIYTAEQTAEVPIGSSHSPVTHHFQPAVSLRPRESLEEAPPLEEALSEQRRHSAALCLRATRAFSLLATRRLSPKLPLLIRRLIRFTSVFHSS